MVAVKFGGTLSVSEKPKNPFTLYSPAKADEMVTKSLIKEGLFVKKTSELFGKKFDPAKQVSAPNENFQFPHDSVFLDDPEKRAAYLFKAATDPDFAGVVNRDRTMNMSSILGRIMGPPPVTFRDSVLRGLIEKGFFFVENSNDPRIESAAFLMERGLNTKELLEQYAPPFDFDEFHRYQSKINRIIDKHLPPSHKTFEKFWADPKLKLSIKHALKVAILENENKESLIKIAKNTRIPYETLRSRVEMGKKILAKHFSDLTPLSNQPKFLKPKHRERQFNGFLLRSSCLKIHPVYRIDPKTGARALDQSRNEISYKSLRKTSQKGFEAYLKWKSITNYRPAHNGVESPLYAHLANAYPCSVRLGLVSSGRSYVKFVSSDEKVAFDSTKPVKFSKKETPATERGLRVGSLESNEPSQLAKKWP